ncbi:MAG: threonine/serine exporter family protein [Dysgonamonadaceae bacterium]|jgi:uncharacterized membrane protein YjjP (DUF1212 family)|nr:threonine/serine exporter family protein [Dysgonamonadaceae bacterium]
MKTEKELKEIATFVADYAVCLLGSGVHTSRVVRNSKRIGESLDVTIRMTPFHRTLILTVFDNGNANVYTEVVDIPTLPVSFEYNSELSSLSWKAYDKRLPLTALRDEYRQITAKPKMDRRCVLLLVGLANAAFCRLFGGDWSAVGIVLAATLIGFFTRQQLQRNQLNHFIVFIVSAFVASMCASTALLFETTAEIAIATSVLFLIPGVPLINGVIDIVEGHTLIGGSRLIQAFLLIVCIAVGLSFPLLLFRNSLL